MCINGDKIAEIKHFVVISMQSYNFISIFALTQWTHFIQNYKIDVFRLISTLVIKLFSNATRDFQDLPYESEFSWPMMGQFSLTN